jgi:SAM-dependent methyltransferase
MAGFEDSDGPGAPSPGSAATSSSGWLGEAPATWLDGALAGCGGPSVRVRSTSDGGTGLVLDLPGSPADDRPASVLTGPDRLPIRTDGVAGVALSLCLQGVPRPDPLFAELRRSLRPTGTLAVLVPASPGLFGAQRRVWRAVRQALGTAFDPVNPAARDHPAWLLTAADFAVLHDQRRVFRLPVPDQEASNAALRTLARLGLLGTATPEDAPALREALAGHAGPGRSLPVPLRLVMGRR